jgi:hypothetical protein
MSRRAALESQGALGPTRGEGGRSVRVGDDDREKKIRGG